MKISILLLVPATLLAANPPVRIQAPVVYDVILRHGTIVDGTGRARYPGDVAVMGGSIARIGDLQNDRALMDLDVNGLVVAPGFINLDSRAPSAYLQHATNMLEQGVTTEIVNSDAAEAAELRVPWGVYPQLTALRAQPVAVNVGVYFDLNRLPSSVRRWNRDDFKSSMEPSFNAGAWGVSVDLDNASDPGSAARAADFVASLARERPYGLMLLLHGRNAGMSEIGRTTGFVRVTDSLDTSELQAATESGHYSVAATGLYSNNAIDEAQIIRRLQYPSTVIMCDCGSADDRATHPRYFGTWPRLLGRYVRDQKVLTLEDAVRKTTALTATVLGMVDRGFISTGMAADVVVFDANTVADRATLERPALEPSGIRFVFVNGKLAVRDERATGVQAGSILKRAWRPRPLRLGVERRLSFSGIRTGFTVGAYARTIQLEFVLSLAQGPADPRATGVFKAVDHRKNVSIDMKDFGELQVGREWASFTGRATLRADGPEQSVTVVVGQWGLTVLDGDRELMYSGRFYRDDLSIRPLDEFLLPRILAGDGAAIQAAGESGDRQFVPALRQRLAESHRADSKWVFTIALAQLGEVDEMQKLWCGGTVDPFQGALDFAVVGGSFGVEALRKLIEPERFNDFGKVRLGKITDALPSPPGFQAREGLGGLLRDLPEPSPSWEKDDLVFQWLDAHRDEYQQWPPSADGVDFSAKACKNGKPVK